MLLRIIVRRHAERQRAAGREAAGADISAAVYGGHLPVALIGHLICIGYAVLRAQRVEREPDVTARLAAQLAQHDNVALIRPYHHSAAEEIQYRALRRLRPLPHDQAWEIADDFLLIIRLVIRRHEEAAAAVLLLYNLQYLVLRQRERLLRTGKLIDTSQNRCKNAHILPPYFPRQTPRSSTTILFEMFLTSGSLSSRRYIGTNCAIPSVRPCSST